MGRATELFDFLNSNIGRKEAQDRYHFFTPGNKTLILRKFYKLRDDTELQSNRLKLRILSKLRKNGQKRSKKLLSK